MVYTYMHMQENPKLYRTFDELKSSGLIQANQKTANKLVNQDQKETSASRKKHYENASKLFDNILKYSEQKRVTGELTKPYMPKNLLTYNEHADKKEQSSDIIDVYSMPEKKIAVHITEPLKPKIDTGGKIASTVGEFIDYENAKDREPKIPSESSNEKRNLTPEEIEKLQKDIYEMARACKHALIDKLARNRRNQRAENDLEHFTSSPYGWMTFDIKNKIRILNDELDRLKITKGRRGEQEINKDTEYEQGKLDKLSRAYKDRVPLKLDRYFTPQEINLEEDMVFKVDEWTNEIGEYVRNKSSRYIIDGVFQRRDHDYIALKNDTGETFYISMFDIKKAIEERQAQNITGLKPARYEEFLKLQEGLGFDIGPEVIQRYMRVSPEEAEELRKAYAQSKGKRKPITESPDSKNKVTKKEQEEYNTLKKKLSGLDRQEEKRNAVIKEIEEQLVASRKKDLEDSQNQNKKTQ